MKNSEDKEQQQEKPLSQKRAEAKAERKEGRKKRISPAMRAAVKAFGISFFSLGSIMGADYHLKKQKQKRKTDESAPRFSLKGYLWDVAETLFTGPIAFVALFAGESFSGDLGGSLFASAVDIAGEEAPEASENQNRKQVRRNNLIILGGSVAVAVATYFIVRNRKKEKAAMKLSPVENPAKAPTKPKAEETPAEPWSTRVKEPSTLAMAQGA